MAKKRKSKMQKILGAALLAGLGAAALRGRKPTGGGDPNIIRGVEPMNIDDIISVESGLPIQPGEITGSGFGAFSAAKGGRAGYGKGGKVSKGCGKVMAGRSKKTKYF
jgi:hypothetical protein